MSDQLPIRIKRSDVEGKRPQNADLQLGELAINTYDGRLFAKKDTGGVGVGTTVTLLTPWTENIGGGLYYNDGNIGIGTTNPTTKLFVGGDGYFTGILTARQIVSSLYGEFTGSAVVSDRVVATALSVSGISTLGTVQISSGIISATTGIVTYYGDASNLTKTFPLVTNVLYVTKNGNDGNPGTRLSEPKSTIAGAVAAATAGTVIKVSAGTYIENNPITLPDQVSIVGDSLREVTITPQNTGDLFYVGNGNYIAEMSFVGAANPGAIFSFDPNSIRYFNQSPYIQNCTNFIQNSTGLKIDGNNAIGPLKSMVLDSYTQYNQGGIGVSITNEGYAQLVSLFTICNDTAVYCGSGAACDLTNSNSSFGNYALVADGVGPRKYTGIITSSADPNADTFVLDLNTPTLSISTARYDNTTGILTAYTTTPHGFSVGMGISLSDLQFTCAGIGGINIYPSGQNGYVFEAKTVAPGRYVDSYNLIQANRQEIINTSFAEIAIQYPSFTNPNPDKCKRDLGYIVDAVSKDVRDYTSENIISATKSYFNISGTLLTSGLQGEVPQTITAFHKARDTMKLAITNNLTVKDLSITADPLTGFNTSPSSCANVQSFIDNLVGILTTRINTGNLNTLPLPSVSAASTVFTCNVGVSTTPNQVYVSGGTAKINVIRPYDGQVIYFETLYYTVGNIVVGSGGTGYTFTPTVTISAPETPWGVSASAVANISNGSVIGFEMISNGRGYGLTPPTVTISAPNSGINSATATAAIVPTYYSIKSSTPVSSGICTITVNENLPYGLGVGSAVPFFKQSRVLASGHSLEYIGSGTTIATCLPSTGGVPIQDNETDARNGGLVVFTSTDQSGNFRIGDGVVVNQQTGTISGTFYSKSLFSTMTPFILALGGR